MSKTFGQRLREVRTARGVTQEELARRLGKPRNSQISGWECNQRFPSTTNIQQIAHALRVPVQTLFKGVETALDRLRTGKPLRP